MPVFSRVTHDCFCAMAELNGCNREHKAAKPEIVITCLGTEKVIDPDLS